jgi:mRNA-degrading endonuclease RelE of RelBE toxin-antitoxin system
MASYEVIRIFATNKFNRAIKKIADQNKNLYEEVLDKIVEFQDPNNHKQLKVHILHGMGGVYSFYVNYKIRVVFEFSTKNKKVASLLYVGGHDDSYL